MSTYLPKEVQAGLDAARKKDLAKRSRLRVMADDRIFPVLRFWQTGFALDADDAPQLRGLVDLFDGTRHLYQCLIVTSAEENGERIFEFKRSTAAHDAAPLDFVRPDTAPVALIEKN